MAAKRGQLECFKVLEEAGATITDEAITIAVDDSCGQRVLSYLLSSGKFDPRSMMRLGCSWSEYASQFSPEASPYLAQAISEIEKAELDAATAQSESPRRRRFL